MSFLNCIIQIHISLNPYRIVHGILSVLHVGSFLDLLNVLFLIPKKIHLLRRSLQNIFKYCVINITQSVACVGTIPPATMNILLFFFGLFLAFRMILGSDWMNVMCVWIFRMEWMYHMNIYLLKPQKWWQFFYLFLYKSALFYYI